jgi:hypothetical protein
MKDIDFLPARFRERDRLRRAAAGRIATLALVWAAVIGAHIAQSAVRRSLQTQLAELTEPYSHAAVNSATLERLRREVASCREFAQLYTYLDHPWPRTQLLAEIVQTLPDSLALTEVRIGQRAAAPTRPGDQARNRQDEPRNPAGVDLQALRDEVDRGIWEVVIRGTARESGALHGYVSSFSHSSFFASAKLQSVESAKDEQLAGSQFVLLLVIRPGYGQPGGPDASQPAEKNEQASRARDRSAELPQDRR